MRISELFPRKTRNYLVLSVVATLLPECVIRTVLRRLQRMVLGADDREKTGGRGPVHGNLAAARIRRNRKFPWDRIRRIQRVCGKPRRQRRAESQSTHRRCPSRVSRGRLGCDPKKRIPLDNPSRIPASRRRDMETPEKPRCAGARFHQEKVAPPVLCGLISGFHPSPREND